ncbi:MAG: hypothetical protein U0694_07130 [Anaerolineae bacterium]
MDPHWIGGSAIGHLFEPLLALFLPEETIHTVGETITVAIAFALVTMLHIVLGELAKSIAFAASRTGCCVPSRARRLPSSGCSPGHPRHERRRQLVAFAGL